MKFFRGQVVKLYSSWSDIDLYAENNKRCSVTSGDIVTVIQNFESTDSKQSLFVSVLMKNGIWYVGGQYLQEIIALCLNLAIC